ncbi:MoaD/ThiS family protein [Tsuneonella sp. HG249]
MNVSFFGKLGETIGREVEMRTGFVEGTVAELREALAKSYPSASEDLLSPRVRACVNDAIVTDSHRVSSADRIALLPPVSGG